MKGATQAGDRPDKSTFRISRMAKHAFSIEEGGIWAAIHTPFRPDGTLDTDGLRRNTEIYTQALGLKGVFFCGLMGEYWSLTVAERKLVVETLASAAGGKLGLAPNCTHHSLTETIELVRHAAASGCHYATLMNPAVGPRTDEALLYYFETVCSASDLEIILFNTPAPGYVLNPPLLARLCELPNVRGIKAAGDDKDRIDVRRACGARVVVSDPMEKHWLENLTVHGQTLLFADPEPYLYQRAGHHPIADYYDKFRRGDLEACRTGFDSLAPLRRIYDRWIMEPMRTTGRPPNAALKAWAQHMGLSAGPTRAPVKGLTETECATLLSDIRDAELATV
jgi:4-hydroxy-tetrahydrodipicolinate synthase